MATKTNTESNNQVINFNKGQQYLFNRIVKLFEHPIMNDDIADVLIQVLEDYKATANQRAIKKIDDEIARLQEMKKEIENK